jgi:hypothetical protein
MPIIITFKNYFCEVVKRIKNKFMSETLGLVSLQENKQRKSGNKKKKDTAFHESYDDSCSSENIKMIHNNVKKKNEKNNKTSFKIKKKSFCTIL